MLLPFSRTVSRSLSFPPGQATHSTPSAPEDLGSLPDWGPGCPSQQAAESALPSGGLLGEGFEELFSGVWECSLLLNFSELDLPPCSGEHGFVFFLNPTRHWKTPQLSFSGALKVLVLWSRSLSQQPPKLPTVTSQTPASRLHAPIGF